MLFCTLKILLNSAILQHKKNRQEFIRIFKERKSIGKGFKINVNSWRDKVRLFKHSVGRMIFTNVLCL